MCIARQNSSYIATVKCTAFLFLFIEVRMAVIFALKCKMQLYFFKSTIQFGLTEGKFTYDTLEMNCSMPI